MNTEFWKDKWKPESMGKSVGPNSALFADWNVNFSRLGHFNLFLEHIQQAPVLNNWTWVEILFGLRLLLQVYNLLLQTQIFWFLHTFVPNCRAGASALRMESKETGWIMCLSWCTSIQDLLLPPLGLMNMSIIFWKVFDCHANRSKS